MATVENLLNLWKEEGFKVVEIGIEDEPRRRMLQWGLWLITSETFYSDYGRHGVIRALYDKTTGEIVKDELFNASIRAGENLYTIPIRGEL